MHPPDAEVHAILNWRWRGGQHATVYVGMSLTTPDEFMSLASITEPTAASYTRVALTLDASTFAAAVDRAIESLVAQTFPVPTQDWGTLVAAPVFTTATPGTGAVVDAVKFAGLTVLAGGGAPRLPAGLLRFLAA